MSATGDPSSAFVTGAAETGYRRPADLTLVRDFVRAQAVEFGLSALRADLLTLAVSELATNTLQHTTGGGRVRIWTENGRLLCDVIDRGPMRTLGNPMPAADAVRGRGLAIVEQICDEVEVIATPDGTHVRVGLVL